jgi:nicotinate-nucleotide--dimethylbenzimidazole phosphoribosyltransferase
MVANFVAGGAAVNVLSKLFGAELTVVDAGVATPIAAPTPRAGGGRLVSRPIRRGTGDISIGPAMTRDEACAAIALGMEVADEVTTPGSRVVAVGEMGIGNTTAASALTAVLLGRDARDVTGRGTGLDDAALARKIRVVEAAVAVNRPAAGDPIGALAAVGGLEIATLCGLILRVAANRIPVVLDGFITAAAALVAARLSPAVATRLIAAHRSPEPGHGAILGELAIRPILELDLRLGEGSGAVLALGVLDAACAVRDRMATFASAAVAERLA